MKIISIIFIGLVVAVIAKQNVTVPGQSVSIRFGSWWLAEDGDSGRKIVETARVSIPRRQLRITSIDWGVMELSYRRSATLIDFPSGYIAVYTHIVLPTRSSKLNNTMENESNARESPATLPDDTLLNRRPVCFIAALDYTLAEAVQDIGTRILNGEVKLGTPAYYTTDIEAPLTNRAVSAKSTKIANFCSFPTYFGKTLELSSSTDAQTTVLTVTGQIDKSQSGKSIPWEIEIQNYS